MLRFMGMMPRTEIEREEAFKTSCGVITIQAGPHGWTILYADGSSQYEDKDSTTDNNFNTAKSIIEKEFTDLETNNEYIELKES